MIQSSSKTSEVYFYKQVFADVIITKGKGANHMAGQDSTNLTTIDVACLHFKKNLGQMTTMKLQKLVYYCQAGYFAWFEMPLFPDKIEK